MKISFSIKKVNWSYLINLTKEGLEYSIKEMKLKKKMKIVQIAKNNLNKILIRKEELVHFILIVTNKMILLFLKKKVAETNRYKIIN